MSYTKEQLHSLCKMADSYSDEQLELAIKHHTIPGGRFDVPSLSFKEYLEACKKYLDKSSEQVYSLTKNNTETVDLVFEICQYILPTMVQQEGNINEALVVFIITLFCRKGIMNYIKKM